VSQPPRSPAAVSTGGKIGLGCLGCFGALVLTVMIGSCASALAGGGSDQAGPPPPAATVTATVSETVEPTATATEEVEVEVTVTATETVTETVTERPDGGGSGGSGSGGGDTGGAPAYYENCDAARAAGAAPVRRGDPGYGSHLDRDGDGVACE
ncbi:excalibur calcium-binding domain-containing protein, partial [Nocardiopsis sp. RV163]|uniref:excalibur calcium-binding domain-containing protein n=1 Tax=Nocardiopsis sp. RV163 TaxID=1661388 RepID=UPI002E1339DA